MAGRLEQQTRNDGATTRLIYSPSQTWMQQLQQVEAGQSEFQTLSVLDGAGRVYARSSQLPGSTGGYAAVHTEYDQLGRVYRQSNPTEVTNFWAPAGDDAVGYRYTLIDYDWQGRETFITPPDGYATERIYGGCGCAGGEVVTIRDERGRPRRRMTSDVLGRLVKTEELQLTDNTTAYSTAITTYNARDQVVQVNHAGQVRSTAYDGYGRLRAETTPEQGTTTRVYNLDDTVQSMTDARGVTSTMTYNNRHLVTRITYGIPAGSNVAATPDVTYSYDAAGNRTLTTDGLGETRYTYDVQSRLTEEARSFSDLSGGPLNGTPADTHFRLKYEYNLADQLTKVTNPWGAQVGYTHNFAGQMTGVTGAGYANITSYTSGLQYRASGQLKRMTYGNGRTLAVDYDVRLRPSRWDVAGVLGEEYSYSYFGQYAAPQYGENTEKVTYAKNLYDATLDRSYEYDQVGRLSKSYTGAQARVHVGLATTGAADGPYAQTYTYDVRGNMMTRQGWGGSFGQTSIDQTLNYDAGNRLTVNPATGTAMTYDAAGHLTADGQETFQYNAEGQQTYASGTGLQQFYDGDRLREKKIENSVVTYYLRSSLLGEQVVAEVNGDGSWRRGYVYAGGELIATQANGVTYVHEDPVTKSQRYTDQAGALVTTMVGDLDPWGGETARSINPNQQPQLYTTYTRDLNGEDDAQQRRYQSQFQRFMQPDPYSGSYDLSDPQSFNRYSYTNNDPVNYTDPSGLFALIEPRPRPLPRDVVPFWFYGFFVFQPFMLLPLDPPGGSGGEYTETPIVEPPQSDMTQRFKNCLDKHLKGAPSQFDVYAAQEALEAANYDKDRASMIGAFWGRESNFDFTPTGDHGPAQLTSWLNLHKGT